MNKRYTFTARLIHKRTKMRSELLRQNTPLQHYTKKCNKCLRKENTLRTAKLSNEGKYWKFFTKAKCMSSLVPF